MNESDRIRFKRAKTLARNPAAPGEQYDGETHIATVVGRQPVYFEKKLVIPCCGQTITPEGDIIYFTVTFTPVARSASARVPGVAITANVVINFESVALTAVESTQGGITTVDLVGPASGKEFNLGMSGVVADMRVNLSVGEGNSTVDNVLINVASLTADSINVVLDNLVEVVYGSETTPTSMVVNANKAKYVTATGTDVTINGSSMKNVNIVGGSLTTTETLTVDSLTYSDTTITGSVVIVPPKPTAVPSATISGDYIDFIYEGGPSLSTGWEIAYYYSATLPVTIGSTLAFVDLSNSGFSYQPPSHRAGYFACLFRETANPSNASPMSDPTDLVVFAKQPTATRANTMFPDPPSSTITISSPSAPTGYEILYYGGTTVGFLAPTVGNSNIITLPGPPIPYVVAVKIRNIADNTIISDMSAPRSI